MRRDSLVLTSSPSRHRTRTTKEAFEDRHVPCTLTRDSHFPRMGVLPAHRSRDRGRMTIHGVQCIRRTRHAHVHAPAWAPRSERARSAPCLGAPLCSPRSARVARALQTQPGQQWQRTAGSLRRTRSQGRHRGARQAPPHSALRASLGHPHLAPRSARRSGASNAAGPAVAAYGRQPAAHRRSQGRDRGARRKAPPRSALRASLGRPLRSSPRSALRASLGTHGPTSAPRSWRRAWGAGAPRWRAEAAALRGNLMAPERLARGARSPNGLHRSKREQGTWRARRLWRAHASPGAKVRKCHDGAWTPSRKRGRKRGKL